MGAMARERFAAASERAGGFVGGAARRKRDAGAIIEGDQATGTGAASDDPVRYRYRAAGQSDAARPLQGKRVASPAP